jgi:hypothetical protein
MCSIKFNNKNISNTFFAPDLKKTFPKADKNLNVSTYKKNRTKLCLKSCDKLYYHAHK